MSVSARTGFLVVIVLISAVVVTADRDLPSNYWTIFGDILKNAFHWETCSTKISSIVDAVSWCWESFDEDVNYFSKHELSNGAGCCIKGKFDYCIKYKVDALCPGATANVTETAISYLRVFMRTTCPDQVNPDYPTIECDTILSPAQTWVGIIGLILAVSIFSTFMAVLVFLILLISKRVRSRDSYMSI